MARQQIFVLLCSPAGITAFLVGGFKLISLDSISAEMPGLLPENV